MIEIGSGLQPPHDLECEAAVLSAVMLDAPACMEGLAEFLKPFHFYSEAHNRIYEAALDLYSKSKTVDIVTIGTWLKDAGRIEQVGGLPYMTEILNAAPAVANATEYGQTIYSKWRLRELQRRCRDILANSYGKIDDVQKYLDSAEDKIHQLANQNERGQFEHIDPLLRRVSKDLIELGKQLKLGARPPWKQTGLKDVDAKFDSLLPGTLTILAARPGGGKSSLALNNLALPVALKDNEDVAVWSLEMRNSENGKRILAAGAGVDGLKMKRPDLLTMDEWRRIIDYVGQAGKAHIHFCDKSGLSLPEIRAQLRRLSTESRRAGRRLGLAIIDYLQLMSVVDSKRNSSRNDEVGVITRGLKVLSNELDIPIVALSQMNRDVEKRTGAASRPQMSDLRDSGSLEQDADNVLFIHKPKNPDGTEQMGDIQVAEFIIAKQRSGSQGICKLTFLKKQTRFENHASDEDWGPPDE